MTRDLFRSSGLLYSHFMSFLSFLVIRIIFVCDLNRLPVEMFSSVKSNKFLNRCQQRGASREVSKGQRTRSNCFFKGTTARIKMKVQWSSHYSSSHWISLHFSRAATINSLFLHPDILSTSVIPTRFPS